MQDPIRNIIIIGSGNLASRLAIALHNANIEILQVCSRHQENAIKLAKKVRAGAINDFTRINPDADLYIIAVSDKAIGEVSNKLDIKDKMIVHTSGSVAMELLNNHFNKYGVLYPLNTFSKEKAVDFNKTPVCIEANEQASLLRLKDLARKISGDVREVNSNQRLIIHTAAVFASNFANHMYSISADILESKGISFNIMKPIIQEVAEKILRHDPLKAQTGPALRKDHQTLAKHLDVLNDFPEYKELYQQITDNIIKRHKK
ncbi:MAG: DUF2520 domain-containing protein [Bacteroidales bacterium]|nr:DUF2520 domain-containing protein [Bacteroidales bacterium]MCF8388881.1 DUF2520 domain-containing protein [Bacteroidales bacterium]MCF8399208.1 DUF2520 domain-containing protein [Bacteroidales bacterium]